MSKSNKLQDICWQILLHMRPQHLHVHAQYLQVHMHTAMQASEDYAEKPILIRFYIR